MKSDLTIETISRMICQIESGPDMPEEWRIIRLGSALYDRTRQDWARKAEEWDVKVPGPIPEEMSIEFADIKVIRDMDIPEDRGYVIDGTGEPVALIAMGKNKRDEGRTWEVVTDTRQVLEWKKLLGFQEKKNHG